MGEEQCAAGGVCSLVCPLICRLVWLVRSCWALAAHVVPLFGRPRVQYAGVRSSAFVTCSVLGLCLLVHPILFVRCSCAVHSLLIGPVLSIREAQFLCRSPSTRSISVTRFFSCLVIAWLAICSVWSSPLGQGCSSDVVCILVCRSSVAEGLVWRLLTGCLAHCGSCRWLSLLDGCKAWLAEGVGLRTVCWCAQFVLDHCMFTLWREFVQSPRLIHLAVRPGLVHGVATLIGSAC